MCFTVSKTQSHVFKWSSQVERSFTLATAVWQIFQMISLSPQTIQAQPLSSTFTEIWSSAAGKSTERTVYWQGWSRTDYWNKH